MPTFLIRRAVPSAGELTPQQLRALSTASNAAARAHVGASARWERTFVAGDHLVCLYRAASEAHVREHARLSGYVAEELRHLFGRPTHLS
ncbi:nickel-binding protein [Occultella glacieicola]|nr:nickel-binding protein [Occultella glacieicola]